MIPRETIDSIFAAARIEEVVGDFVNLKRRGVNFIGLCPFHNEKTPSFNVNPVRGIYKCFGCGKGGNSVNFIMEHEKMNYISALKFLARKYNIEVIEEEQTEESREAENKRESLRVICTFAQKFFTEQLHTEQGKAIGLSYFEERGFTPETIEKFQLGYSPENPKAFLNAALKAGHNLRYLYEAGLIGISSNETNPTEIKLDPSICYDRYRGRVIFPIHSSSGLTIAFAGRTLRTDKDVAKYVNSRETILYHKSETLYGLDIARKQIASEDNCYLVEGYADVISMHQAGVENVVASSGTSLTVEQVELIRRFTPNLTILYDGDAAGLKAAERGLRITLKNGMNVKIITLPPEDDPDTFSRKHSKEELKTYLKESASDVLMNSIMRLSKEADPLKKAENLDHLASLIVVIPDRLKRNGYVTACLNLLDIDEEAFRNTLARVASNEAQEDLRELLKQKEEQGIIISDRKKLITDSKGIPLSQYGFTILDQEKELIRVLIKYGNEKAEFPDNTENIEESETFSMKIADYIIQSIEEDGFVLEIQDYKKIYDEYYRFYIKGEYKEEDFFVTHSDPEINQIAFNLFDETYKINDWSRRNINVKTEKDHLTSTAEKAVFAYKTRKIELMLRELQENIMHPLNDEELKDMMMRKRKLDTAKSFFKQKLGRVI